MAPFYFVFVLLFWAAGLYLLYWIIRLAVRHGIEDTQKDRFE